ncbi:hypothetical protein EDB89DRAFT_1851588, partial [Lactarius sanguifluus]
CVFMTTTSDYCETQGLKNLLNDLCTVSMRDYNHKCSGHLVLHELELFIKFPPDYVITTSITHFNIGVSDNE